MRLLLSFLLLTLTATTHAADRQFSAAVRESGGEVVVRVQREPGVPACGVGIEFGPGRMQNVRLEDDVAIEVRHRYESAVPVAIEVSGRASFRGLRSITACLGDTLKVPVARGEHKASLAPAVPTRAPAAAGRRVALLVGNDAYRTYDVLPNSVNDARLVGEALRRIGFETIIVPNASRVELMSAIERFEAQATGADAAIFYFSGHGVQDRMRRNYLMPVDARMQGEASISGYGVEADLVVGVMERLKARVGLILLDACRSWPPGRVQRTAANKNIAAKGMTGVYPVSPPDGEVLVQFATREGEEAEAGSGVNSPYAIALAASLERASSMSVRLMLDHATGETLRLTGGQQRPVQFGDMHSQTFLVERSGSTPAVGLPSIPGPDEQHWRRIERTSTRSELMEFSERYPRSRYTEIAKARLNHMDERERSEVLRRDQQAWMEADRRGTRESYEEYMRENRNGAFHQQARARIDAIGERERVNQAARDEQERSRRLREQLDDARRRPAAPATSAQTAAVCDVSGNPRTYGDWNFNACVAAAGLPTGVSCNCRSPATGILYMGVVKVPR